MILAVWPRRKRRMPLRCGRIWLVEGQIRSAAKGIQRVKLCHTFFSTSAGFDDPSLVSAGGLVPVLALAERAGLASMAGERLTVPTGARMRVRRWGRWSRGWSLARTASRT